MRLPSSGSSTIRIYADVPRAVGKLYSCLLDNIMQCQNLWRLVSDAENLESASNSYCCVSAHSILCRKVGEIERPYTTATRTRFVQPGKIETDANERAVIGKAETTFSFAPPSILSLTSCRLISCRFAGCSYETTCRQNPSGISGLLPVFPLKRSAYFLSLIYRQQKKIRNTKTVCL